MAINVCAEEKEVINPPSSVLNVTENGNYSLRGYDIANVNVSGGGSGDLTTAKVTLKSETGNSEELYVPVALDDNPDFGTGSGASVRTDASSGHVLTFDAILYKGVAFAYPLSPVNMEVTGAITNDDGLLIIRGDGTITLKL